MEFARDRARVRDSQGIDGAEADRAAGDSPVDGERNGRSRERYGASERRARLLVLTAVGAVVEVCWTEVVGGAVVLVDVAPLVDELRAVMSRATAPVTSASLIRDMSFP